MTLEGVGPHYSIYNDTPQPITVELSPVGGGSVIVLTFSVNNENQGNYTFASLPAGKYTVNAKGFKWLRSAPQTVDLTASNATLNISLNGCDANNDNYCNTSDFGLVVGAYETQAGNPGYDPNCDFNCDGSVDQSDYSLLVGDYGSQGTLYAVHLTATAGSGHVALSWTAVSGATYNLYRSTSPAHGATAYRTGLTTNAFTDLNVPNGKYYYQVVATGTGIAGLSNEASATVTSTGTAPSMPVETGRATAWEAMISGVNTVSGNKLTELPIVSWTARGGLPVDLTLYHNSQGTENGPLGPRWTHSFDLTGKINANGSVTLHGGDGRLTTYALVNGAFQAPPGFHSKLTPNGTGYALLTKSQITYQYATSGATLRCVRITDTNSNTIALDYTGGPLYTVTDPTGRALTFNYNTNGQIAQITDPLNRVWTFTYPAGQLVVTEPELDNAFYSTTFTCDSANHVTDIQTRLGPHWKFGYDAAGKQTWQQDPLGNQTTFTYSSLGALNATIITDPNGNAEVCAYDSGGRLQTTEDAEGYATQKVYDADNNVRQITDRRGKIWQYQNYDVNGNLWTAIDPYNHQTTYTYTPHNRLATVTDANNHLTQFFYDGHDNLTKITDARHNDTILTPGAFGLLSMRKDANLNVTTYSYDPNGELKSVLDAKSHSTLYQPNALGWTMSVTDGNSLTTQYVYDNWGRLKAEIDPQDPNAPYTLAGNEYDANDNLLTVYDSNFNTTDYYYDDADRQIQETRGNGDTILYGYDADGQKGLLSYKLLGNGAYTAYAYTPREEVSAMTDAIGTRDAWTYDPNGNLASHTDSNGVTTGYDYYDHNLLQHIHYPTNPQVGFTYDPAGRKIGMSDATGPTTYGYDDANNLTGIAAPNGTTTYHYDPANRQDTMTLTVTGGMGTGTYTYGYDKADNLISVTNPFNEKTSYLYDAADQPVKTVRGTGSATIVEETIYDSPGRVQSVLTYLGNPAYNGVGDYMEEGETDLNQVGHFHPIRSRLLSDFEYAYDAAGNLINRSESDANTLKLSVTYGYDGYDQLKSESAVDGDMNLVYSRAFTYDHAGNRISATHQDGTNPVITDTYTYLVNTNRLLTAGNRAYTYDNAGNVRTLKIGGTLTQTFAYDEENRVGRIDYPSRPSSAFQYNGLRLRTGKRDSNGLVSTYVTDGDSPGSDVLSDGQAIYTPGLYERRGNVSSAYLLDGLGNLRSRGSDTLLCDAFGQTVSRTGTNPLPFGFEAGAGYQSDADSGLTLVGNRYYDGAVGHFLQPDPSGQEDNEYAYAENNPVSNDDPDGLQGTVRQHPKPVGNGAPHKKKPKGKGKGKRKGKSKTAPAKPVAQLIRVNFGNTSFIPSHYFLKWTNSDGTVGSMGFYANPNQFPLYSNDPGVVRIPDTHQGEKNILVLSETHDAYFVDELQAFANNITGKYPWDGTNGYYAFHYMFVGHNCYDFADSVWNNCKSSASIDASLYSH